MQKNMLLKTFGAISNSSKGTGYFKKSSSDQSPVNPENIELDFDEVFPEFKRSKNMQSTKY
jgi:hypothetical protein